MTSTESEAAKAHLAAQITLFTEQREACAADYESLYQTWRGNDTKAQGVITTCGILIAAVLAFMTRDLFTRISAPWLVLAILCVAGALFLALATLWARALPRPGLGDKALQWSIDLSTLPSPQLAERLPFFFGDQARAWSAAERDLRQELETKGTLLFFAQALLAVAVGCVMAVIVSAMN